MVVEPAAVPGWGLTTLESRRQHSGGGSRGCAEFCRQPGTQPVIVALPAEVHLANAGILGRQLATTLVSGIRTVIADLSATTFCDSAGARMLALVYVQAIEHQVDLRLAIPGSAVRRALERSRLHRVLPVYMSLDEALAGKSAAPA